MTAFPKVKVLFCGGVSFRQPDETRYPAYRLPTQDELAVYIGGEIARSLSLHIKVDFQYIGGCETGANQTFSDWNNIGRHIAENYDGYDGFVVLHGQDTIPWAASQLAYSLQNLAKPVIFADGSLAKGALGEEKTRQTIITAIQLAAFSKIPEVCVLSSKDILIKGVDAIQIDAGAHCGFISRNNRILAHIGREIQLEPSNIKPMPEDEFIFVELDPEIEIAIYEPNPVAPFSMSFFWSDQLGGMILNASGFGSVPLDKAGMRETLNQLKEERIPVVIITQDVHGFSSLEHSGVGQQLKDLNVIDGQSMTAPAARAKLAALIAMQTPYDEMPKAMAKDIFGETKSMLPILRVPDTSPALKA